MVAPRTKRFPSGGGLGILTSYWQGSHSPDHNEQPSPEPDEQDPEPRNLLVHLISQLRPGADLSRVTLPTHFLEPRSMLERITNFMAHPELLLPMATIPDPVGRFVAVIKFYMSGWHIKPLGVKKPLNPVLGEFFTGYWDYQDGTRGYYLAEQTSHHPPKSSYFFMAPHHHIRVDGTLKPRSRFLGNSAASIMEGIAVMTFLNYGERYFVAQPNIYVRNLLWGKMRYELGDIIQVHCPETRLRAQIEFKTKGYVSGRYNEIYGKIFFEGTDELLYELSGIWTDKMYLKDVKSGVVEMFFDASQARHSPPATKPLEEQEDNESQRLWSPVITALASKDQDRATSEKTRIEEEQRKRATQRAQEGIDWKPRFFRPVNATDGDGMDPLDWIIASRIDGPTPDDYVRQILGVAKFFSGQMDPNRFPIPAHSHNLPGGESIFSAVTAAAPHLASTNNSTIDPRAATLHSNPPPSFFHPDDPHTDCTTNIPFGRQSGLK